MGRQGYKDLSIEVPDDWSDKTMVIFTAPLRPGKVSQPNVVITRDELPAGETIRTYANKQLTKIAQSLREFELVDSREMNVNGVAGVEHSFTWEGEGGPIFQRMILVGVKGTVYNATATAPQAEVAGVSEVFDRILASLTVGSPAAPLPAPGRPVPPRFG